MGAEATPAAEISPEMVEQAEALLEVITFFYDKTINYLFIWLFPWINFLIPIFQAKIINW